MSVNKDLIDKSIIENKKCKKLRNLSDYYKLGDVLDVLICKPINNKVSDKFPIGRINGESAVFTFEPNTRQFFIYGSTWRVEVVAIKKKNVVIRPLFEVKSAESTSHLVE